MIPKKSIFPLLEYGVVLMIIDVLHSWRLFLRVKWNVFLVKVDLSIILPVHVDLTNLDAL